MTITVKGIRCTEVDCERNRLLRLHRAEGESESELMRKAMRLGMRMFAAAELIAEPQCDTGYDPHVVAQRLKADLLPVLEFLSKQGCLPSLLTHHVRVPMVTSPAVPVVSERPYRAVVDDDLRAWVGRFLDEYDD